MIKTRWLVFSGFLVALAVAMALACADGEEALEDLTLFDPGHGTEAAFRIFQYDPNTYSFGTESDYGDHFRGQNLSEWADWMGLDSARKVEWDSVLYSASLPRLDSLIFHLQGKGDAPLAWRKYRLLRSVDLAKLMPALWYAGFAARVEPWSRSVEEEPWVRSRKISPKTDADKLLKSGQISAKREKDAFLRQRWFFQLAKLEFYAKPDSVLAFLEAHESDLAEPSESLRWRAAMYKAGALRRSGVYGEANLECAKVAVGYEPLAAMAGRDFQEADQSHWLADLALAKTIPEKCAMWFLAGLKFGDLEAVRRILALDSANPLAAVLAARHMARQELSGGDRGLDSLVALVDRVALSRRTSRPAFWIALAGHVLAISGKEAAALARLETARSLAGSDTSLQVQIRASKLVARMRGAKNASRDLEAYLVAELPALERVHWTRWGRLDGFVRQEMARIWKTNPVISGAAIGHRGTGADSLRLWRDWFRSSGSAFDSLVRRRSGWTDTTLSGDLATALLYDDRYAEAYLEVQRFDRGAGAAIEMPFDAQISDNHDRDHEKFRSETGSFAGYLRELARLEGESRKDGPAGAKAALRLGIGLYNRTEFGNYRIYEGTPLLSGKELEVAAARRQFERAARDLPSAEGRAWATWLVAKCERDSLILGSDNLERWRGISDNVARYLPVRSYAELRVRYSKEKFWKNALRECGWLALWNDKN